MSPFRPKLRPISKISAKYCCQVPPPSTATKYRHQVPPPSTATKYRDQVPPQGTLEVRFIHLFAQFWQKFAGILTERVYLQNFFIRADRVAEIATLHIDQAQA